MDAVSRIRSPRSFALWFGVLGPPLAWGAHLLLGDLIFELGCGPGVADRELLGLPLHGWSAIQTAFLLAVSVAGGLFAFAGWRQARSLSEDVAWAQRARAFALAGMASGAIYSLLIAYGFFALVLDPCAPPL